MKKSHLVILDMHVTVMFKHTKQFRFPYLLSAGHLNQGVA